MAKLDSYFFLGGEKIRILAITPSGLRWASIRSETISTLEKVLKILSFIFFPIILVALALRCFLHRKFEDRQIFYTLTLDKPIEQFIAKHPEFIEKSFLDASPVFFSLPKTMRFFDISIPEGTSCVKITQSIKTDKIVNSINSINIDTLPWASSCLHLDMGFTSEHHRLLIEDLKKKEYLSQISHEGKKRLIKILLEYLFDLGVKQEDPLTNPNGPRLTLFPETMKKGEQLQKTFWFSVFFNKENMAASPGVLILAWLVRSKVDLQTSLSFTSHPDLTLLSPDGLRIYWESSYKSILKDCQFIP
ncbi:DUF648 domain-containing protein [Chlamydia pneumoniae]|uniref:DUF648 domain-containing protein n=1 Tax=Chlamydia pneumoniae TaxID=83558 RepID=UPI001F28F189|nr:DUF648 domain-containing protein [Chlamydia pneumoniae]